jgi:hypothetical protein
MNPARTAIAPMASIGAQSARAIRWISKGLGAEMDTVARPYGVSTVPGTIVSPAPAAGRSAGSDDFKASTRIHSLARIPTRITAIANLMVPNAVVARPNDHADQPSDGHLLAASFGQDPRGDTVDERRQGQRDAHEPKRQPDRTEPRSRSVVGTGRGTHFEQILHDLPLHSDPSS